MADFPAGGGENRINITFVRMKNTLINSSLIILGKLKSLDNSSKKRYNLKWNILFHPAKV